MSVKLVYALVVAAPGVLSLLWQIYRAAKEGARLDVHSRIDMEQSDDIGGQTYLLVTAVNAGTLPTTITHVTVHRFPSALKRITWELSWWFPFAKRLRARIDSQSRHGVVVLSQGRIPALIEPGNQWMGFAPDDDMRSLLESGGAVYIGVSHVTSRSYHLRRIRLVPAS